jgi:hypothetical protein
MNVWLVFNPKHKLLKVFGDSKSARHFATSEAGDWKGIGGFVTTEMWEVEQREDTHEEATHLVEGPSETLP